MISLTDAQESTLIRWASYSLGRPQDGFMAFLMGETGLHEEQINDWWTNQASSCLNTKLTPGNVESSSRVDAYGFGSNGFDLAKFNLPSLAFDSFGDSIQNFDATFFGLGDWSPLENSCYDLPQLPSTSMACQTQKGWGDDYSEKSFLHSNTMSSSDTESLLSMPSSHGSRRASGRSSGFSCGSRNTWGTTSTLFSVEEDQAAGSMDSYQGFQHRKPISLAKVMSESGSQFELPDDLKTNHFNTHDHSLESVQRPSTSLRRKSSTNINAKKLPDIPQKFVRYGCTICGQQFERKGAKGDWKRHEQTKCEQQKLWYCMPKEPTTQVLGIWYCMLCNYTESNRNEMIKHLIDQHRFQNCWGKPLSKRSHPRKDKLRDHLKKHHGLSEGSIGWENWHQDLPEKKAWGCGFCGGCFITWDARLDHIAEHYEKQGLDVSHWSLTNVIKGLLKQPREWDISHAWKALVGHNDRLYTWLDDDAIILQRKLEYREDTPQNLAEEARRLAKRSSHNAVPQTWSLSESQAVRLAQVMLAEPLRKTSARRDGGIFYGVQESFMAGVEQTVREAGVRDGKFNGYI
ncbi:hypothetical protein SBOR_7250 [Sclerotinia borealis F-4128]|uniref:C2H2-type domain-containing protein n=1 Tax=Sclerotinia borealis (strain F-4128) TaxID=1432307 RepID=W9C950_SCLBF|nr:hypothetical protein SBOR_7250 [Sclerotinia borealis F-4128]